MTRFSEDELKANVRLNLSADTPAGTINQEAERGFSSPSRALYALKDAVTFGWFASVLDTENRRHEFLEKVSVTFQRTWDTAKYYLDLSTRQATEIASLRQRTEELDLANRTLAAGSIEKEQRLKNSHRDEVAELQAKLDAANETKGQLEERLRTHDPVALEQELEETKNLLIAEQLKDKSTEPERAWKYELAKQELHAANQTIAQLDNDRRNQRAEIARLLEERCVDPGKHEFVFKPVDPASRGSAGGYQ